MIVDTLIKNVKILYNGTLVESSISILDGKIFQISKLAKQPKSNSIMDGKGLIVLPGVIDVHVHFRDPGRTHKEDFITGSMAAAAGGVTTIIDMPNTIPPTNTLERYKEKKSLGESKSLIDFSLHAGVPEKIDELERLLLVNVPSIKVYMAELEDPFMTLETIYKIIFKIHSKTKVVLHPEDPNIIKKEKSLLDAKKVVHNLEYHYLSRNPAAEVSAVNEIVRLLEKYQVSTHLCHISVKDTLPLINSAKAKNLPLSAECTPHHMFLSYTELFSLGPIAKCDPPLRTKIDNEAIRMGLKSGLLDIVSSDHAPHTIDEKQKGEKDITKAPSGIVGTEIMLPLVLSLVKEGFISLSKVVEILSEKPAELFNLDKGKLQENNDADLILVDLKKEWTIKGSELHGKTKFTPFEGRKVVGRVIKTILRGELIYDDGEIIGKPGFGKFVYPNWSVNENEFKY